MKKDLILPNLFYIIDNMERKKKKGNKRLKIFVANLKNPDIIDSPHRLTSGKCC
jgi:hypothetical protein